ncbi:ATP-binding protein [Streptomyces sp. NBC_00659]|uniref:ATP-binding protein n=1 Tax=Streptomyces sp. NBC_00659 TaxID=2903669 RepID=UPI002E340324|nr:ATP-binding protein [Streptomyces sp. NBC_00659]
MAPGAIDLLATPRRGRFARLYRRPEGSKRRDATTRDQQKEASAEAAPTSWLARNRALWSRALQPIRPFDAPRARVTPWESSWPLSRELTSARRARRLVTAQLDEWNLEDVADTAELLVSELVTNALCHTRGPLRLNLCLRGDRLLCEVEDTEPECPVRREVDADAEGGRGTELLDLLAESWGSTCTPTGKTMWFEVPTQTPS